MFRSRWKKLLDRSRKIPAPRRRTIRPTLEALEERTLLTAGTLDSSFGLGGLVTTNFAATGMALALQPDGKIVVAGYAADTSGDANNGNTDFALARYNTDGSLDTTFGNNGEVLTDFSKLIGPGNAQAWGVAVQADGKIVVAGFAHASSGPNTGSDDFALARYDSSGTLDNSFGVNGRQTTDFTALFGKSGEDQGRTLALQNDGKIVVAGFAFNSALNANDLAVARYNVDGNLDSTFGAGGNGRVTTNVNHVLGQAATSDYANAVAIQPDGRIVAAGGSWDPSKNAGRGAYDFALVRYTAAGELDGSFNTNGTVRTDFSTGNSEGNDFIDSVAFQGDGKIVAVGAATPGASAVFALARYTVNGQLDTSFGGTGKITTAVGTNGWARGVAIQDDGEIVAAGFAADPANNNSFAVARYNPADGSLDPTFNPNGSQPGVVVTPFPSYSFAQAEHLVLQSDGKIVVAGFAAPAAGQQGAFALARYLAVTGTVQLSTPAPVTEGQTATITITRSDTSGPASVQFSTSDGTATAGVDYTPIIQTVQFAAGQASATVAVPTIDDNGANDGSKTVNLTLSNPSGVALGSPSTAVLTIQEPLPQETIQLDRSTYPVAEGASPTEIQVVVDRNGATGGTVDVPFQVNGGSAVAGRDYTVLTNSPLEFQPGVTQQSITITILPDMPTASDESFTVTLDTPTSPDGTAAPSLGSPSTASVTIQEPETVQLDSSTYSVQEGAGSIQLVVDRTGATVGTVSVPFQVTGGSATAGHDYTVATSAPLVFQSGETQKTITVNILPDASIGTDESFTVALGTPTSPDGSAAVSLGSPAAATVTILEAETFAVSGPDAVGHNGGSATYTVTRSGSTDGTATVQWSLSGSALSAGEYQGPSSGTLTIGPGLAQGTISIPISNNGQYVGDQSLTLTLTGVTLSGRNAFGLGTPSAKTTTIHETNHRPIVAELVPVRMGKKIRFMVEVLYANDGTLKTEFLSPFQQPAFHGIQASAVQGNGAGLPDQVLLTARKGRRTVSMDISV
jgi:uncharacterized delta-60 repeat protein